MGVADFAWIIDDGPLDMMAAEISSERVSSWPVNVFFVAQATYESARQSPSRWNLLLSETQDGETVIRPFEIMVGGSSDDFLYGYLRRNRDDTTANLADHQAIAWALLESPQAIFITSDKRATILALIELGRSRVCHPFEFWKCLWDETLISASEWRALCNRQIRGDQSLIGIPWRFR